MKKLLSLGILVAFLFVGTAALAEDQYVKGHYRSNGTYVSGYYRTQADNTPTNNYSYQGNTNPYTGQRGYDRGTSSSTGYYNNPSSTGHSQNGLNLDPLY